MKTVITKFIAEKAGKNPNGELYYYELAPESFPTGSVFHWIKVSANTYINQELNDVPKTFIIVEGDADFVIDGEKISVKKGDVIWFPKGSKYDIKTGKSDIQLVCIKIK
jgi:mannose-6-phosphate isomerase-like protein (cupin superfamily)